MDHRLPALRTRRLRLEPTSPRHAVFLHDLLNMGPVRRFLCDDALTPFASAAALIEEAAARVADGLGLWTLLDAAERAVGVVGLAPLSPALAAVWPEAEGEVEPTVAIAPEFWSLGYGGEALRAVEHYAFADVALPRLAAAADAPNRRSRRLLASAGYAVAGTAQGPANPLILYRKHAPQRYRDSTEATVSIESARRPVSAEAAAQSL